MAGAVIDETHDPARTSWVESANGHASYAIQNLPIGIFTDAQGSARGGIAIGDDILDLAKLAASDLLHGDAQRAASAASGDTLVPYFDLRPEARRALRATVSDLLAASSTRREAARSMLTAAADTRMMLPCAIRNFSDFFAGIHHARAASRIMRGTGDVAENYKHVPIAYHGRASSVRVSGTPVHWPNGQMAGDDQVPQFGPSRRVDYETEVAMWVGGRNALGESVPIDRAGERLIGLGMLNDWSARDLQRWEAAPLGPFLSKSFMTTVSPWIVGVEALAPFRAALERGAGEPPPLPYLSDTADLAGGAVTMRVQCSIRTAAMFASGTAPHELNRASMRDLYWTPAQMIAHHTSNGCDLASGDLLGTGTISAPPPGTGGALLELTEGGRTRVSLPGGETRGFLEGGDEIILEGFCERDGYVTIGTGLASGTLGHPTR